MKVENNIKNNILYIFFIIGFLFLLLDITSGVFAFFFCIAIGYGVKYLIKNPSKNKVKVYFKDKVKHELSVVIKEVNDVNINADLTTSLSNQYVNSDTLNDQISSSVNIEEINIEECVTPKRDVDFSQKNDVYSISINELIFGKPYKASVEHISNLLDNNGYFGRYKIEQVKNEKSIDTFIKIHVYLVDSAYTYTWPFQTQFNIDKKCYAHNRKVPRGVFSSDNAFYTCLIKISQMYMSKEIMIKLENIYNKPYLVSAHSILAGRKIKQYDLGIDDWAWTICQQHGCMGFYKQYKKVIPYLVRVGLIANREPVINNPIDATEVYENLFDINYWHNL